MRGAGGIVELDESDVVALLDAFAVADVFAVAILSEARIPLPVNLPSFIIRWGLMVCRVVVVTVNNPVCV